MLCSFSLSGGPSQVNGEEERGQQDECKSCVESQSSQKVSSEIEGERREENEEDNGENLPYTFIYFLKNCLW